MKGYKEMRITEEQQKAIANRLGITSPEQPNEVADYLTAWDAYKQAVNGYQQERISVWNNKPEEIQSNALAIEANKRALDEILALGVTLQGFSVTTQLATKAWNEARHEYERAIEKEHERPEREFRQAKDGFIASLEKEQRSLKTRITRAENKRWQLSNDDPEKMALSKLGAEMTERLEVVRYILEEAQFTYQSEEVPTFSEDAILLSVAQNGYKVERLVQLLTDKIANEGK